VEAGKRHAPELRIDVVTLEPDAVPAGRGAVVYVEGICDATGIRKIELRLGDRGRTRVCSRAPGRRSPRSYHSIRRRRQGHTS
jgi:hypothetical protein